MSLEQGLYILLNKTSDFQRGVCLGTELLSEGSGVRLCRKLSRGLYLTRIYDSLESGMEWHRISIDTKQINNSSLSVTVYTCNHPEEMKTVSAILQDAGKLSMEEAELTEEQFDKELADFEHQMNRTWKPYLAKTFTGSNDVLLHTVKGRYLWMVFDFRKFFEKTPKVFQIRVEFPKRSYLDFLPEIYRQDEAAAEFLHRFLSIFQKMDEEMEESIDNVLTRMDPCSAEREYLEWMAEILGMESYGIWNDDQLRYLVRNAASLYKFRGTKGYLEELIGLYCGTKPIILTYQECKLHQDITCDSPYEFVVLLKEPENMNTDLYQNLLRIIEMSKPAWMECRLILLRPYCLLDEYSYIGVNSVLGQYSPAALNDEIMIPYATLEG